MNIKRKGNRGEFELAGILRDHGIDACRNDQYMVGGRGNPDVYAEICGQPLHVEVKRAERLNVNEAMHQAMRDAESGYLPVVAHRRNREPWLVTVPLLPLLDVLRAYGIIVEEA